MKSRSRVMVIQLERLGDLVQTTPLLADLRRANPDVDIELLAWTEAAPIVDGMPGVELRTIPSRLVKELNDEVETACAQGNPPQRALSTVRELELPAYDRIINVSHGMFSAWLAARVDAGSRDGGTLTDAGEWLYAGDWLTFLVALTAIRGECPFNLVDLYRGCAAAEPPLNDAHGYAAFSEELPIEMPQRRLAVVAPGANEEHRRFNVESTAKVFALLDSLGFQVVLVGAPSDVPYTRALAAAASIPVTDLTGRTEVRQLGGILRRADIVLSADSGPAHIAAALGRPVVGLYGASLAPFMTAPWGEGHIVLVSDRMEHFNSSFVMAAVQKRLNLSGGENLRKEALAAHAQAWSTSMLPPGVDALGGLTYRPLHTDHLDGSTILRRLMRHVMASIIMGQELGDMTGLASFTPPALPLDLGSAGVLAECERQLSALAADVAIGSQQLRLLQFERLHELAERVERDVDQLQSAATQDPLVAPVILFLVWKLRMMPAYSPETVFKEHERELQRAVAALRMARHAVRGVFR